MHDDRDPRDDFSDDEMAGLLPIREVARRTGVNPVTLRAWERRYGLIVPQRTAKGHRLYSQAQVAQVQQILDWLERGVSVSQVRGLLSDARVPSGADDHGWRARREQLLGAIANLAERALDDGFNQAVALYPPATVCRHLLLPLLEDLHRRWVSLPNAELERAFFLSWLRSKLGARLYHSNRLLGSAPLLLVNCSSAPLEPALWLCAWLVGSAECPVSVLDWPLPAPQLALAVQRMQPRAVLLYASEALDRDALARLLQGVACPCLLCGPAAERQRDQLAAIADLHLTLDPLDAQQCLHGLGLLGLQGELRHAPIDLAP
ncbi:Transcriptional regulator, MerR family [Pseudomonas sp. OF001]|uniref:MerR family transcriptional regulator n=1 Tax=Pseudomonas sp. OF001 TaxID=2772300 RepID=UPI00191822A4|nr:MerR family transcriptional regulator [Pseudomonas sp. OF001]CAD5377775.1 Transcriptional regulator, MerR family [Pseudomonas sp. OF001]